MEKYSTYSPLQAEDRYIEESEITIPQDMHAYSTPESGGIVSFIGAVRNTNNGKSVQYLEYECMESMCEKIIAAILSDAHKNWDLQKVYCKHRVGKLFIGDIAVIIITAAAHRDSAYEANQYIINRIKHEAPIWKKEFFTDGSYEWGNNCNCKQH